ncbi:hypothetical protein [Dysgonomonas sp. 25]|uniref:hypothetical protein n=1 Tax=Dysgonomonas sp. 25 TaxID=2302933 RepID=UPI0013D55F08|nr:hypothetical protein [Dysgonomonas sp. 25]NDV69241.1 hypothetical protein [Dysgonomonas sp. 25]
MKRLILTILLAISAICLLHAQNQTVNGNLTVTTSATPTDGGITIGKVGYAGILDVPKGGVSLQYNIDFQGYRDIVHNQIAARISALRTNRCRDGFSAVQSTALLFYTNELGVNAGTTDLFERMRIAPNGNVGIGMTNPTHKLDVNGTIHAKEVKIDNNGWADFVFETGYKLPTLSEVEAHIQEHKRLPEIPSEAEVKEKGVDVGEMQVKLLQKVEELTLYVIELEKKLQKQDATIQELQNQNK